jgi:hypothetical protein
MSFPVAEVLRDRGVPFVFATGYGSARLEDPWRGNAVVIKKPFALKALQEAISQRG